MTTGALNEIDWTRPWLEHLLPASLAVLQHEDWRDGLNAAASQKALHNHEGLPLKFVAQEELPAGMAYEAFIGATGAVPTRSNLHDFFNALVWLTFPKIKVQLNALQAGEIARYGNSAPVQRGELRDAATLFDENAALLVMRNTPRGKELEEALRTHRWQQLFVKDGADFGCDWEVWLFGHALMEKLVKPYKAITAHAWITFADDVFFGLSHHDKRQWLDENVSRQLSERLAPSCFSPLPVAGLPGWWNQQDQAFYEDVSVFRPKRTIHSCHPAEKTRPDVSG